MAKLDELYDADTANTGFLSPFRKEENRGI